MQFVRSARGQGGVYTSRSVRHERGRRSTVLSGLLALAVAFSTLVGVAPAAAAAPMSNPEVVQVTAPRATVNTTVASNCSNQLPCGAPATLEHGLGQQRELTRFTAGGQNYRVLPAGEENTRAEFLRVDNAGVQGQWHTVLQGTTGTTINDRFNLVGADMTNRTMEDVVTSAYLTEGTDNTFANVNGVTINNIERISILNAAPMSTATPALLGATLIERGGNDSFKIAAITNVDANGSPTAWGPILSVGPTGWGTLGSLTSTVMGKQLETDTVYHPINWIAPQNIGGIYVSFAELGIAPNQNVYGVSLVGGDQTTMTGPWLSTTPNDGPGGLDLISAVFASAVSPNLALTKTSDPASGSTVAPGDVVTYTVEAQNLGNTELSPVQVRDDLADVLDDAQTQGAVTTQINGEVVPTGAATITGNELAWNGTLQPYDTVTITYSVVVGDDAGGTVLNNRATAVGTPPDGAQPLTPPAVQTTHPVVESGFVLDKTSDPASGTPLAPGETITYTLTGTNTGDTVLSPATIADDLSGVLAHATYNADAVPSTGTVTVAGDDLTWAGTLAPDQTVSITYSVTADADAVGVTLNNVATGSASPLVPADPDFPTGPTRPGVLIIAPAVETEHAIPAPGLSLTKAADPVSGTTVLPGDLITYTLTATNTGDTALADVTIDDDLSEVLSWADVEGAATSSVGAAPTIAGDLLSWTGDLDAGATVTVTYAVRVDEDATAVTLTNTASASAVPLFPGAPGSPAEPGEPISAPEVSTDHPVAAPGFTIAKTADPVAGSAVEAGDIITYTVTGTNTGDAPLAPAAISDDLSGVLAHATFNNDAEATSGAVTVVGDDLDWTGVLPVGESVTVTYSVTVSDQSAGETLVNVVTGTATPTTPSDPSDPNSPPRPGLPIVPEAVETSHSVVEPGFVIEKSGAPASGESVLPGESVTYTVTGTNTGDTALDPASIVDDLAGVLDDATYNGDVEASIGAATVQGNQLSWTGPLAEGESVTITYSVTVIASPATGSALTNQASGNAIPLLPEDPADPDSPTRPGQPVVPPTQTTENPILIPDFELVKTADPASGSTVLPGETITYTVTGTNTGETLLDPATISDDLTEILANAQYNGDVAATTGAVEVEDGDLSWTGSLAPGQTVTITYSVTVADDARDVTLTNVATASGTPLFPTDPSDPDGPTRTGTPIEPEPASTEHSVLAPGFVLTKTADPASGSTVLPGEVITYTLTGTNTGQTVLDPALISDDLADVLSGASYNSDAVASRGTLEVDGDQLSWSGSLLPDEVVTITYSVTVAADVSDITLTNVASAAGTPLVPVNPAQPDGPTRPGEPITPSDVETEHPVVAPGFVVTKTADPAQGETVLPGETVTYTVTGTNSGDTALAPASLTDDLSDVLAHAEYNGDVEATTGAVDVIDAELTWTGALPIGASVSITYSVTVAADARDASLANVVTGSASPLVPVDPSDPDSPTRSGEPITPPPAATQHPVLAPGFTVTKTADPGSQVALVPGEIVTYTVTGTNTGQTALQPAAISDDLSGVLSAATYNGDAEATSGTVDVDANELSWEGSLPVGSSVTITYSVTVTDDAAGETLTNTATGSATPLVPVDPTDPDGPTRTGTPIEPPAVATEHPVLAPGFAVTKTADPVSGSTVLPGETITYTVTGTNSGETSLDPALISDDLSEVLSDASYNADVVASSGSVVVAGNTLEWTGPLAVGATVTITYSVTVAAEAADVTLANVVTGTATPRVLVDPSDPDGPTRPGTPLAAPEVRTEHPVLAPGFQVTKSSDPASGDTVLPGETVTYTVTGTNTGATTLAPATLADDLSGVLAYATYNGDVEASSGLVAVVGDSLTWSGPLAIGDSVTITYSVTVADDASDVAMVNVASGSATPVVPVDPTDPDGPTRSGEPVAPPAVSTENPVVAPGFAVSKTANPGSGSTLLPGETVTYTVTGTNTGQTVLDPASLVDDLEDVFSSASYNEDAAASTGTVVVEGSELTWTGRLGVGESVTVTYSVTVEADAADVTLVNTVSGSATPLIPVDPADPDGPTRSGTPIVPPSVSTEHPVVAPGFAITKAADPLSGAALLPGDTVTYTITGTNTGATVLAPAQLSDDLSGVLGSAVYNGDVAASIGAAVVEGDVLNWSGALAIGESVTITYSVTVGADPTDSALLNVVAGSATPLIPVDSSTPDGQTRAGAAITPPPVQTEHSVLTPALELSKIADPASGSAVIPGDVVTYTVTARNTGNTVLDPATVTDDLSGVLANAQYNGDVEASRGSVSVEGDVLSWSGSLPVDGVVNITYSVTVGDVAGSVLTNTASAAATPMIPVDPANPDSPLRPGAPVSAPPVTTEHPVLIPGFAVTKTSDPVAGTSVLPGQTITYTLTGTNTGETVLDPARINDDLTGVLAVAAFSGEPEASTGVVTREGADLSWAGPLALGESVTLTYSVIVDADVESGAVVENAATSAATPLVPSDPRDPLSPVRAGADIVPAEVATDHPVVLPGFAVTKTADPADGTAVNPGDVITYTVTGANTGDTELVEASLRDDLSGILQHAELVGDAVALVEGEAAGTLVVEQDAIAWSGALALGQTVTLTYSVRVNDDAGGSLLTNVAAGSATPPAGNGITAPEVSTTHPVLTPGFALSKTADPASGDSVRPGQTITYTVTGENTGESDFASLHVVDDLASVLAHATYNDDAVAIVDGDESGAVAVEGSQLEWTGVLPVGQTVTVTYSVTVAADAAGETLVNVAGALAITTAGTELQPPQVSTEHPVIASVVPQDEPDTPPAPAAAPLPPLALTGGEMSIGLVVLTVLLLAGGAGLVWAGRRSRRGLTTTQE